jgi:hypothetical protein
MIINEVAFIDGASLLESTHQCLLLWEGYHQHPHLLDALIIRSSMTSSSSVYDRVLIAYSKCLNKCLTYINNAVLDANIYEDEDFQPSTVPTLSNTNDDILINDINNCINELNSDIHNNNDDKKLLLLLISRLNQLKNVSAYHNFINNATIIGRKGSNYGNEETIDSSIVLQTIELHSKFKQEALQLLESLNEVDNTDVNEDNRDSCSFFFDPNPSKLQQTSAIRTIFFKSFTQSLAHMKGIIDHNDLLLLFIIIIYLFRNL